MAVSIIIPCYNAARWLREAMDSCLAQTYRPIEIIVIDDGSTDDSLAIIRSYGDSVRYETGPHYNGSHARNRGFALSRGDYIQFLDADDFLLPDKLGRQVNFLEETGADVVYGDWRHQFHQADGAVSLGAVVVSGAQTDVLEALLADWWVAPVALLFRRQAVERSGGWDETLQAGQDRDFFTAVALSGAEIRYQSGCYSIYRRYGNVTVSTGNRRQWLENHRRSLEKVEQQLQAAGRLSPAYRQALSRSYFHLARQYYEIDRLAYQQLMQKTLAVNPDFQPDGSKWYNSVVHWLGYGLAEKIASLKKRASSQPGEAQNRAT